MGSSSKEYTTKQGQVSYTAQLVPTKSEKARPATEINKALATGLHTINGKNPFKDDAEREAVFNAKDFLLIRAILARELGLPDGSSFIKGLLQSPGIHTLVGTAFYLINSEFQQRSRGLFSIEPVKIENKSQLILELNGDQLLVKQTVKARLKTSGVVDSDSLITCENRIIIADSDGEPNLARETTVSFSFSDGTLHGMKSLPGMSDLLGTGWFGRIHKQTIMDWIIGVVTEAIKGTGFDQKGLLDKKTSNKTMESKALERMLTCLSEFESKFKSKDPIINVEEFNNLLLNIFMSIEKVRSVLSIISFGTEKEQCINTAFNIFSRILTIDRDSDSKENGGLIIELRDKLTSIKHDQLDGEYQRLFVFLDGYLSFLIKGMQAVNVKQATTIASQPPEKQDFIRRILADIDKLSVESQFDLLQYAAELVREKKEKKSSPPDSSGPSKSSSGDHFSQTSNSFFPAALGEKTIQLTPKVTPATPPNPSEPTSLVLP